MADRDALRGALLAERNKRAMVQNKLDLAAAARDAARTVEHDYDEIVTLLEAEVAHLRAQLLADPDDRNRLLIDYRKRCACVYRQLGSCVCAVCSSATASAVRVCVGSRVIHACVLIEQRGTERMPSGPMSCTFAHHV